VINPGSRPVEGASEAAAEANMQGFIDAATERGLRLADEPERHREADVDGRYAWILPVEGGDHVQVLMPGADIAQVRDDLSSHDYCLRVGGTWWWWNDAIGMVKPLDPGRR
jgi:hypothetical protein